MASISENQMNLKTLQRVDSSIVEIIDNACQVAVYKYERRQGKWEETDVEGTLFLYRRSTYPYYGLIIINRMSTTNFIESITSDMQFQLQSPYLLYKNHSGDIIGFWFYEHKDLQRISKTIQTIILKHHLPPKRQRRASESETQDILTLLCEAHKEYIENRCLLTHETTCENINNLNNSKEKKCMEKSMHSLEKENGNQNHSPSSPRRRYMSTGSFDSCKAKCAPLVVSPSASVLRNTHASSKTIPSSKQPCDKLSAQTFLQDSYLSEVKEENSHLPSLEPTKWQNVISENSNAHFASIKEVIMSHIEENTKFMPKIHEAYVSSLKTYFT